jgi:hypothetical protein
MTPKRPNTAAAQEHQSKYVRTYIYIVDQKHEHIKNNEI